MEGISDIKISSIDEKRPPVIRKEPYIDIFFKMSHKAPIEWCKDLNGLMSKHPTSPKINESEGLYIEAWVRSPDEVVALLASLKKSVAECNKIYIERVELLQSNAAAENAMLSKQGGGEQERLNKIIANLNFDEIKV